MKKLRVILIGAGNRGTTYARLGKEHCPEFELVAVADPKPNRRNYIRDMFNLPEDKCFESWEDILALPKMADAAIIATQDYMHYEPAMKAIELGYHLLLEKPAAPTPAECLAIDRAATAKGLEVIVCHVLRFTPFFTTLKRLIEEGRVGRIINMIHLEGVGNIHQSHSYVRGNWGNVGRSTPMILAKSCHDIDILQWLLNERCTRVQSFGSLSYFKAENKPEGAPEFCVQGCPVEDTCPYHAGRIYHVLKKYVTHATGKHHPTKEDVDYAINNTNYGRCVFQLDNDAVDHQVVNLEYEDGATVSFTMSGFNKGGRKIRIMGTKGEIYGDMSQKTVSLYSFDTLETEEIPITNAVTDETIFGGHGGGDLGIIKAFCQFMTGTYEGNSITDITTSVENHLVTFAAEDARLSGCVVTMKDYIKGLEG